MRDRVRSLTAWAWSRRCGAEAAEGYRSLELVTQKGKRLRFERVRSIVPDVRDPMRSLL